ncbi:Uncharacterised protein r2_g4020 [Pycnogonum litorale]
MGSLHPATLVQASRRTTIQHISIVDVFVSKVPVGFH